MSGGTLNVLFGGRTSALIDAGVVNVSSAAIDSGYDGDEQRQRERARRRHRARRNGERRHAHGRGRRDRERHQCHGAATFGPKAFQQVFGSASGIDRRHFATEIVFSGGTAIGTQLSSSSDQVLSGGTATGTLVSDLFSIQFVRSGGTAVSTTVISGTQFVNQAAQRSQPP